jgi:gamma-tubulin complex component 3
LIKDNPSPENALRFSNLYSRLLTQPVLSQKWAILYLFYQLSDSDIIIPNSNQNSRRLGRDIDGTETTHSPSPPRLRSGKEEKAFEDAFAPSGLPKPMESPQDRKRIAGLKPLQKREGAKSQTVPQIPVGEGLKEKKATSDGNGIQQEFMNLNSALIAGKYANIEPSETVLLRDLPFTLQGLSSASLPFTKTPGLKLPFTLPSPIISLLHTLAEPSLLYQNLEAFVQSSEGGLLGQSLRAAVGNELRSYLALVATLEGQIKRTLSSLDGTLPKGGIGKAGVTLKRCVVWTREATMGLRLLSLIAEESKSRLVLR